MNNNDVIVGIDTSNYTTSLAAVTVGGELVANIKHLLPVRLGECGLRQSDALFAHIKNLPQAFEELRAFLGDRTPVAIGVSTSPRNVEGSYMPVFLAGVNVACAISSAMSIPLYSFSHQCGHVMAALYSSGREELIDSTFAAFHVSGGTTELLRVSPSESGFFAERVGGTLDINAGQLVDRIGVRLGLPFPAGRHLEALANEYSGRRIKVKVSADGMYVNLSGIENQAVRLLTETEDPPHVAAFVLESVAVALRNMATAYMDSYGNTPIVFAGGVMSNSIIKGRLADLPDVAFAEPSLSSDNAVGIALLAKRQHIGN